MSALLPLFVLGLNLVLSANGAATFTDCGGASKSFAVKSGSVRPDPIQYPGNIHVDVDFVVLKDLPAQQFEMELSLTKLEPRRMTVPCLEDIGSCTYDVCQMIENHKTEFCPMFPNPAECGCPMKAGNYSMKNAMVKIPDFGEIFVSILQGSYEGNITFIDKSTSTELGCMAMTFQIVPSPQAEEYNVLS